MARRTCTSGQKIPNGSTHSNPVPSSTTFSPSTQHFPPTSWKPTYAQHWSNLMPMLCFPSATPNPWHGTYAPPGSPSQAPSEPNNIVAHQSLGTDTMLRSQPPAPLGNKKIHTMLWFRLLEPFPHDSLAGVGAHRVVNFVPGTELIPYASIPCLARICESAKLRQGLGGLGPKDGSGSGPRSGLTAKPCRPSAYAIGFKNQFHTLQ